MVTVGLVSGIRASTLAVALGAWGMLALACSSDPAETNPGGTAGSAGTDSGPCVSMQCTCTDGRTGLAPCSRDASNTCSCSTECDCSSCPTFELDVIPPFDACGGDPLGIWRSVRFAPEGFLLSSLGAAEGDCPADLTMASPSVEFLMNIGELSRLEVYRSAFSVSGNVLDSCIKEVFGVYSCSSLEIANDGSCLLQECGVCDCDLPLLEVAVGGSWSVGPSSIAVSLNSGATGRFEHCVRGDLLELREPSGMRFDLERVQVMGTPTPCAERTSETCSTGGGSCTLNGSQCTGAATATCALKDYGKVPGCEFVP